MLEDFGTLQVELPPAFRQTVAGSTLLERLPVGIYCCDRDGRLLYFNRRAAELWGRSPAIGDPHELFCGAQRLFLLDGQLLPHASTPMAEVLRTGLPASDVTVIVERPDGGRRTVLVNIEPVFDDDGGIAGAVNCFQDISEVRRAQEALEAKERQLQALLEALPAAVYTTDADGRLTFYNRAAVELAGYRPVLGEAAWCVSWRLRAPDGTPMAHDACPMAIALKERRSIAGAEAVAERPDGTRVPFLAYPTVLYDENGRLTGAVNMLVDITQRKESEARQQLLLDELNHRVRNTLATIQSIASQTLRHARSPEDFVAGFNGRVLALARAHGLLTDTALQGVSVMELVRGQLVLGTAEDERITCSGPAVVLPPQAALHMGMALHELGINARKHGALSVPGGRLDVRWEVRSNGARRMCLYWRESGGPRVEAPVAPGFGTTLVARSLEGHGGEAQIRYDPEGLACRIELPLEKARDAADDASGQEGNTSGRRVCAPAEPSRILVVEDEPLVAMDVVASLEAEGYDVVGPARTLVEARRLIDGEDVDAVLLDANLAGDPVDEIALALARRGVPFAFLTGYGREALSKAFASAPMLAKPYGGDELRAMVRRLLHTAPPRSA